MEVLFTILAERYERRSVMISSNLVFSKWDQIFKREETCKKVNRGTEPGKKASSRQDRRFSASAGDSASLRCAPRGQRLRKGKT